MAGCALSSRTPRAPCGTARAHSVTGSRLQVWATGTNSEGQLGLGHTTDITSPQMLTSPTRVVQVSTGRAHTMFLDEDGRVRAFCSNVFL